jgi:hypothetical protein
MFRDKALRVLSVKSPSYQDPDNYLGSISDPQVEIQIEDAHNCMEFRFRTKAEFQNFMLRLADIANATWGQGIEELDVTYVGTDRLERTS